MSTKLNQTLETVTNIAIISLVVLFGYILVQKFVLSPSNNLVADIPTQNNLAPISTPQVGIQLGVKVNVPDVDWKENRKTLVIYSRKGCHFCTESMPFYKELARKQSKLATKIVIVSSDSVETSRRYFSKHGVALSEIRQAKFAAAGIRGTPTLLLVNDKGEVSNSWIGRLSKEREMEVISQL